MERNDEKYKWGYIIKEPRAGRLFRSRKLEDNKKGHSLLYLEEDNFGYMGAHDGVLYVDGGAIDDMKDIDIEGYLLIDKDGTVYTRDDYSKEYPTIVKNAIENGKGCYICIVDIHS